LLVHFPAKYHLHSDHLNRPTLSITSPVPLHADTRQAGLAVVLAASVHLSLPTSPPSRSSARRCTKHPLPRASPPPVPDDRIASSLIYNAHGKRFLLLLSPAADVTSSRRHSSLHSVPLSTNLRSPYHPSADFVTVGLAADRCLPPVTACPTRSTRHPRTYTHVTIVVTTSNCCRPILVSYIMHDIIQPHCLDTAVVSWRLSTMTPGAPRLTPPPLRQLDSPPKSCRLLRRCRCYPSAVANTSFSHRTSTITSARLFACCFHLHLHLSAPIGWYIASVCHHIRRRLSLADGPGLRRDSTEWMSSRFRHNRQRSR